MSINRKALVVGINYYKEISPLYGCVNDAYSIKSVLDRNSDGTINFSVNLMVAMGEDSAISRRQLKDNVQELFYDDCEVALFYFAGHGYIESVGGFLLTSDCKDGDDGLSLNELLAIVNTSRAKNKIIVLDSCHSGIAGTNISDNNALLSEGVTILTASSAKQYATEMNGSGVFTTLFVDALNGGSSNLVGEITPGSVYAHIDQSLGPWEQRPIFKTNVKNFVSLRKVNPPISLSDLKLLPDLFEEISSQFQLDPSFEPESEHPFEENTKIFRVLQNYNRVNLVVPIGAEHMYFAAINSKSCELTPLGMHYWNLVKNERI
ncbi:caspase family protein [Brevibacillus brevis]|uniref:Caspase family protein n=1 Tax=Brevibacillus brevis TaxID=1393 RepID=A0A2Z4MR95_BREBE|nr:caspase family protein [Brevibacillus brevis]AWX59048.1 caspase family protein [Brevibacillus brevis]